MFNINYLEELEPYMDKFEKVKISGGKLIACSPFRIENKPSFAINLENGTWIDSGNPDGEWYKGNFIKLLSFFREESYEDTLDYLKEKYCIIQDTEQLSLNINLNINKQPTKYLDVNILQNYRYRHKYLYERKLEERILQGFRIGYDIQRKMITIPIFDKNNNLVNIKYRSVNQKIFRYHPEGNPVKQHLFALNHVVKKNAKTVYIVEGEIDCMYLWQNGYPAVATFGAYISSKQRDLLLSVGVDTIIIASDNDVAGERFAKQLLNEFACYVKIGRIHIPQGYKDVNDLPPHQLQEVAQNIDYNVLQGILI